MFDSANSLLNGRNRYQLLVTLIINIIALSHGIGLGWISPTLRSLQTDESPLSFDVSISELSWIGSALGMGSITGNILAGFFLDLIGRKWCLTMIAIPHSCLWILSYLAPSVEYLYVGRYLAGITGGGMYIVSSIFVSEIADANIRGSLGSIMMVSVNLGVLFGYIIGTHMPYYSVICITLIAPSIYFLYTIFFLHETPQYLIRRGKFEAAEKSYLFYKNGTRSTLQAEFDTLKMTLTKNDDFRSDQITFRDFFKPQALKSYAPAFILLFANQASGLFASVNYMSDIFERSGSTMDSNTCTIIIGVVQLCGTFTTMLLCDKCGRKILLLVSTAGVVLSLTAFGLFTQFARPSDMSSMNWMPLVIMSLDIFLGNIGLVGCFFVVLVEVFPAKIRSKAASIAIVINSFFVFLMLNIFPLGLEYLGLSVTMLSCAGVTALCFVGMICLLKETKGKSLLDE